MELKNPSTVRLGNGDEITLNLDLFALFRQMTQELHHVPANGGDFRIFQFKICQLFQFVEIQLALDDKFFFVESHELFDLFLVEFVLNLSDQLSDHVIESHDADCTSVLVHHHRKMRSFGQKLSQEFLQRHKFRDRGQFPFYCQQVMPFILHFAHQILDVDQPNRVIQMPLNQRKARVPRFDRNLDIRIEGILEVKVNDVPAWSHNIPDHPPTEIKRVDQQLVPQFGPICRSLVLRQDDTQLLLAVHEFSISDRIHSEDGLHDPVCGGLKKPDGRTKNNVKEMKRRANPEAYNQRFPNPQPL